jgi:hypothetical protein
MYIINTKICLAHKKSSALAILALIIPLSFAYFLIYDILTHSIIDHFKFGSRYSDYIFYFNGYGIPIKYTLIAVTVLPYSLYVIFPFSFQILKSKKCTIYRINDFIYYNNKIIARIEDINSVSVEDVSETFIRRRYIIFSNKINKKIKILYIFKERPSSIIDEVNNILRLKK